MRTLFVGLLAGAAGIANVCLWHSAASGSSLKVVSTGFDGKRLSGVVKLARCQDTAEELLVTNVLKVPRVKDAGDYLVQFLAGQKPEERAHAMLQARVGRTLKTISGAYNKAVAAGEPFSVSLTGSSWGAEFSLRLAHCLNDPGWGHWGTPLRCCAALEAAQRQQRPFDRDAANSPRDGVLLRYTGDTSRNNARVSPS